jgi:hypothetical protein
LDHILALCTSVKQDIIAGRCLYSCFVECRKAFDTIMRDKLWECLQRLGVPPHLQQAITTMYTAFYTKVQINRDTHHGEVMSGIGVKQGYPLSPTLYSVCTLMNLKHIWMRSARILCAYLTK